MQGLKKMREARGLTQCNIAQAMDVRQSTVAQWERGVSFPRKDKLDKLCEFFDCKIDDLL